MEEEPGGEGSCSAEVLSGVPRLSGAAAGPQRGRAADWPRPPVPGGGTWRQPVCGVGGRVTGGAREGLRPDSDGGGRALCQTQRVQTPVPDHTRQAALLCPHWLHALHTGAERRRHDGVCSDGDASEILQDAQ